MEHYQRFEATSVRILRLLVVVVVLVVASVLFVGFCSLLFFTDEK